MNEPNDHNQYNIRTRNWHDHLLLTPEFYMAARLDAARKVYKFLVGNGWSWLTDEDLTRIIGDARE